MGESTSGMLGMALAAKYPERLHSLIICSSPTYLPPAAYKLFSIRMGSWQEGIRTLGSDGWEGELAKLPATGGRKDQVYLDWWAKEVGRSSTYGLDQYSVFLENELDGRNFMKDINAPTLILAPTKSSAAPVSYALLCISLIVGIKNLCISKLKDQRWYLSMEPGMRFMSTSLWNAIRKSMLSSTV